MDNEKNKVNIFAKYDELENRLENHFTNILMSILKIENVEDPNFVSDFFSRLLALGIKLEHLEEYVKNKEGVFASIVNQYLPLIRDKYAAKSHHNGI